MYVGELAADGSAVRWPPKSQRHVSLTARQTHHAHVGDDLQCYPGMSLPELAKAVDHEGVGNRSHGGYPHGSQNAIVCRALAKRKG